MTEIIVNGIVSLGAAFDGACRDEARRGGSEVGSREVHAASRDAA